MVALPSLPEDPSAERTLLATLCAPGAERAALECAAALRPEDFMVPAHRTVFLALKGLLTSDLEINLITLQDALSRAGELARVGGVTGLSDILGADEVARPGILVDILQRHRRRRELIRLAAAITRKAQEDDASPEEITDLVGQELARIARRVDRAAIKNLAEISDEALANLADEMAGVRTDRSWVRDWPLLNGQLGGFHPGQLIVLAARPGVGKTALALNWINGVTGYGKPAGIFSLEMPAEALWRRLAASVAGVDLREMLSRKDSASFRKIGAAREILDKRGVWVQDRARITPMEILGEVDGLLARQPNLGLLVVDHLHLVTSPDGPRSARLSEADRLGEITRAFKILAKDRNLPVLLLVQLNREIEHRSGGRPQLSDLRGSGSIEQDADVVVFIHKRPRKEGEEDREAALVIAKQREGPLGDIPLEWDGPTTTFRETQRQTRYEQEKEWV